MTRVTGYELHISVYRLRKSSYTGAYARHSAAESWRPDVDRRVVTSVKDTQWLHSEDVLCFRSAVSTTVLPRQRHE